MDDPSSPMALSSKLLQLQTAAAHASSSPLSLQPHRQPNSLSYISGSSSSPVTNKASSVAVPKSSYTVSSPPSGGETSGESSQAEEDGVDDMLIGSQFPVMRADRIRCSRCHDKSRPGAYGLERNDMVPFGVNSWYCARCASLVGFVR